MQALTMARRRLRAQIQSPRTPRPVRLAHGMVESGRGRALPWLSSHLARCILSEGYTPQNLERIYAGKPGVDLLSRISDGAVLRLPLHEGLRERFEAGVGELCAAIIPALVHGQDSLRLLMAPCGSAPELPLLARRLRDAGAEFPGRLSVVGVDPDPHGESLLAAETRAREAGLQAVFLREDLRRRRELTAEVQRLGPLDVAYCVGLTQRVDAEALTEVLTHYTSLLKPGGTLILDRWSPSAGSGRSGLGVELRSLEAVPFQQALRAAGIRILREHPTGEGGCVLVVGVRQSAA